MREFKFRAWNGKEFINANKLTLDDLQNNGLLDFQQYTGFKDKSGLDIYEGDILQSDPKEKGWEAKWSDQLGIKISGKNAKIIGNIYENPELLELK